MAYSYTCNCPDASQIVLGNPYSRYIDRQDDIDLRGTGMGSTIGVCKHIYATMIARGELAEEDIPLDIPGAVDGTVPPVLGR